jgi:hypothetical protein
LKDHPPREQSIYRFVRNPLCSTKVANTIGLRQSINHYITYSVITAQPALTYTSVLSTIRCYAITSGDLEGSTFVEYTGNFSSDADAGKSRSSKSNGQNKHQSNAVFY